jgi:hypothetical protein
MVSSILNNIIRSGQICFLFFICGGVIKVRRGIKFFSSEGFGFEPEKWLCNSFLSV